MAEPTASELITQRIADLGDWRGETLGRMRALIHDADPEVVEEWEWRGVPVWSHAGIICTGESYKQVVKLTFTKDASLEDPSGLFNASLEGDARRAIDPRGRGDRCGRLRGGDELRGAEVRVQDRGLQGGDVPGADQLVADRRDLRDRDRQEEVLQLLPALQELPAGVEAPRRRRLAERAGKRTWLLLAGKIPKEVMRAARRR